LATSFDLPADVFQEGEVRPTRTKKKKAAPAAPAVNGTTAVNNKRSFSNSGLDVSDQRALKKQQGVT